ncbi:hypothetical protein, partial [Mesorhizobium sp.]|uniref:hypothetical protein n=1 Tax=Mesorhizobium sp. TaxID=1871066 RepID=UPI0025801049
YSGGHLMAFSALPVLTDPAHDPGNRFRFPERIMRKCKVLERPLRVQLDAQRSNVRCAPVLETTTI